MTSVAKVDYGGALAPENYLINYKTYILLFRMRSMYLVLRDCSRKNQIFIVESYGSGDA